MEIKIELPNNVKVTCPSAHCAVTILRCVSFRVEHAGVQRDVASTGWAVGAGRPGEGEGWMSAAAAHDYDEQQRRLDDFNDFDVPAGSVAAAQIINREVPKRDEDDDDLDDVDDIDDAEFDEERQPRVLREGEEEEDDVMLDDDLNAVNNLRKRNTRGRHAGSMDVEEEDSESHVGVVGELYLPATGKGVGERTHAVFNFIRNRLVFSMKDIVKYASDELGMAANKKSKKKLRKSLKLIKKAGFIEKCDRKNGTERWRKVS